MSTPFTKIIFVVLSTLISTISYSQCEDFVVDTSLIKQSTIESCDGQITLLPSGGTPPYSYTIYKNDTNNLISNSQTTSNLCEAVYICSVEDAEGCEITHWIYLSFCNDFDSHSYYTNPYNGMCNGTLSITLEGGTPPYNYLWYIQGGDTLAYHDTTFTNLCPNTYMLRAMDANNCLINTGVGLMNATIDTCNNLSIDFTTNDPIMSEDNCESWINVNVTGGTLPYVYLWENDNNIAFSDTALIYNLCAGNYYLTVTDSIGCTYESEFNILIEDPCDALELLTMPQHPSNENSCNGLINVYKWYNWLYQSTEPELLEAPEYTNLCEGIYNITYTDTIGCSQQKTVQLGPDPFENLHAYAITNFDNQTNNCNGNAKVFVGGGIPPYSFSHSSGKTGQYINGLCPGLHQVTVTDASSETYVAEYVIADINSTFYCNSYADSTIMGEISGTPSSANHAVYYYLLHDFEISSFDYNNNQLNVVWSFYYALNEYVSEITQTFDMILEPGVYSIELGMYDLERGEPRFATAKEQIYISPESGIQENNLSSFDVFPNPFKGRIEVQTQENKDYLVYVYDVNGRTVYNNEFYKTDKFVIETSELESGFYIISIFDGMNLSNIKMIKE